MSSLKLLKFSFFTLLLFFPLILDSQCVEKKCVDWCKLSDSLLENTLNLLTKAKDSYQCPECKTKLVEPLDCSDIFKAGYNKSGIYTIFPRNRVLNGRPIKVYCDMDTDGGGWTVFQRRGNFQSPVDYFFRDWQSYKKGFGDLDKDFWMGNDNIYAISNQRQYSARFDLQAVDGSSRYAHYGFFWIDDENNKYTLHIQDYSGDAGDSMDYHKEMKFTTKDRKNDKWNRRQSCGLDFKGGWWYNSCHQVNINGLYLRRGHNSPPDHGLIWKAFKGYDEPLEKTEIKLRPKSSTSC